MDRLLQAILDDDRAAVKKLLKQDSTLVAQGFQQPILYQSRIFHWLYVGDTTLHLAAAGYRAEIAKLLIAAGADPNSVKNHRWSGPLHYAADGFITEPDYDSRHQVKMIECLLSAGAAVNAADKNGATPLHRAVRTRSAAAVKYLLAAGADAKLRNNSGSTPFHLAVQNTGRGGSGAKAAIAAQREIIETLLAAKVSTSLKDGSGKTVLDCARSGWIRDLLNSE